jgi:hypothetical protein
VDDTVQPAPPPSKKSNAPKEPKPAPAPKPVKEAKQKKTKEVASAPAKQSVQPAASFKPMQGPDLGISNDKQQQLSDLLQKYRADQVTAEEYHQQRAKILAAP